MTSPGEGVTVFTSPYLSAGAPALGKAKGLIAISNKIQESWGNIRAVIFNQIIQRLTLPREAAALI